ncbi:type I phosphomannose isomerase catalytic subunit [Thermomonospora umbrina]|uniref:Mannose-6-phosphate isomerase n=1 Tax=Thermomonospora umbrina TaxID=111806 RepID=A0A3D9SV73_9ACTN|nr:type I phosphomannose isomerase catalytic subunit [Thermomonospora umbrina]REE99869.1 mannose-6-phosphate isomerase [Thermomonospora umbrina]
MDWYPLRLTTPVMPHVFGGHAIAERLGRTGLPPGRVAETWEVSDVDGQAAEVNEGPLAGRSLRSLVAEHPEEMMGRGWRGARFPVLTKFIDATRALPVHLHADDETARRLEDQPNGKTEAWHILDARPGATALAGVKPGVDADALREALSRGDFDTVMRRLPVRAGQTIYVPGGTLHRFGPGTLVYEIEQTSNIQQHAMRWRMEDGAELDPDEWRRNIDMLIEEWRPEPRPDFQPGLALRAGDDVQRVICCASPYFALERWRVAAGTTARHALPTATILSNVGGPVRFHAQGWSDILEPARTLLLPAALGEVEFTGPADVMLGYLPDLRSDVLDPLAAAGYGPDVIAALGDTVPR